MASFSFVFQLTTVFLIESQFKMNKNWVTNKPTFQNAQKMDDTKKCNASPLQVI